MSDWNFEEIVRLRAFRDAVVAAVKAGALDCGDNSCSFAPRKGGMRTNGGCSCLDAKASSAGRAAARALRAEMQREMEAGK